MKIKGIFKLSFRFFLFCWVMMVNAGHWSKWRRSRNSCVNTLCQCWRQDTLCCQAISSSTVATYTNEIGVSFLVKPVIIAIASRSAHSRFWCRRRHDDVCSARFDTNIHLNRKASNRFDIIVVNIVNKLPLCKCIKLIYLFLRMYFITKSLHYEE